MRVLLIHPDDGLQAGPWNDSEWDRVIDLGRAGMESYRRAAVHFRCPVTPLSAMSEDFRRGRRVKDLLTHGVGLLLDSCGLDWWELTSILIHSELETAILLQDLLGSLGSRDEVWASRPSFHAEVLKHAIGQRLKVFQPPADREKRWARHYVRLLKKFPARELLGILWDKHDPGYQLRGMIRLRGKPQDAPVVLLPTAYVNVSRTGLAYADSVPETRFLLVATRRSGWVDDPPANVSAAWLRSYASVHAPARKVEYADLLNRWDSLRRDLENVSEFSMLYRLGCLDNFSDRLAQGLEIRDAWRNVLDVEPVQAVICADDTNPYTHIPLLLAKERGLPTISCHHGALDGRYMFKRCHADVILAKGKMEQDYLVRVCGVPENRVEVGAPIQPVGKKHRSGNDKKSSIVFFSEPYEAMGGRGADVYQDILPGLANLALSQERHLVVKLHPFESASERRRIVCETLSPDQRRVARVISGPLQSEMLDETWFGITILSTVAAECARHGIPCFLCKWLESSPYGYVDQFTRFGVGIRLNGPDEIEQIPGMLRQHKPEPLASANLWSPIAHDRLRMLLGIGRRQQSIHSSSDTVGKL
jgi:hypothetical protein